jgi:hypothetical protein
MDEKQATDLFFRLVWLTVAAVVIVAAYKNFIAG